MKNIKKVLFSPFRFANYYETLILEEFFKISFQNLITISYVIQFIFVVIISLVGIFFQLPYLVVAGVGISFIFPFMTKKYFDIIITKEKQQFELDFLFLFQTILAISRTLNSESYAFELLSKNSNPIIKKIGVISFIEKNTLNPVSTEAIIDVLSKLWKSTLNNYIISFFKVWAKSNENLSLYADNFQKIAMEKLENDNKSLEDNITIINGLITIFPILIIFLIFIGLKTIHPLLEITLSGLIIFTFIIKSLDPLRIKPMSQFFIFQNKNKPVQGTIILQELQHHLQIQQDFTLCLQMILSEHLSLNKNVEVNNFVQFSYFNLEEYKSTLIKLIALEFGSYLEPLLYLLDKIIEIDLEEGKNQLQYFMKEYNEMEQHYEKKKTIITREKKKSFTLITINTISIGILSVLLPFFNTIITSNFTEFSLYSSNDIGHAAIEGVLVIEFFLIIICLFLSFVFAFHVRFTLSQIRQLFFIIILYIAGFTFSIILTRATINFI